MAGESRELALATSTERLVAWFRIIGGVVGIVLTVTDQVVHPPLERTIEVASLAVLAVVGVATLVWLRRSPGMQQLHRGMRLTFAVDTLVLIAEIPLHAFTVLEAPSPALLVPLVGAVRFGYRGAVAGTAGVAAAWLVRGVIAVNRYDGSFAIDPAVVTVLLSAIVGLITAHLFETARAGRQQADAATDAARDAAAEAEQAAAVAREATARAEAVHRVLADGVGGGVEAVGHRLVRTVHEVLGASSVRLIIDEDGDQGLVHVTVGEGSDGSEDAIEAAVRYGSTFLGDLVVVGATRLRSDIVEIAQQVGIAIHAARLLDREAALGARYRELDQMRTDFMTLTTHELRTPVAAIVGATQTLLDHGDRLGDAGRDELHALIERQGQRLTRLVDDLLTVGRSDSGTLDYHPKMVRVGDVVDDVQATLRRDIETDGDPDLEVWVDPDRCSQVLLNLVENAFDHGVEPVALRWHEDAAVVLVHVVDAGPGIPREQREQVWERFVQLVSMRHHSRGTGLGLGISRDLARGMGGDVWLAEDAPTTTFVVKLPAGTAAAG